MPKSKVTAQSTKKTAKRTKTAKTTKTTKTALAKKTVTKKTGGAKPKTVKATKTTSDQNHTEEYAEYLERYGLYGEGRPRLSPSEFERLDEELLDLLALETEQGVLNDEQIVRLQELEYLLLDSEQ
jgi:hypothetical protein